MPLAPGTILGVYQVIGSLGAGGMGEVYRARDTKLNRDVALKVLPHAFSNDGDRVARINREAQVLASLNHPNIAAIYGSEGHALVMELIEGEDLAADAQTVWETITDYGALPRFMPGGVGQPLVSSERHLLGCRKNLEPNRRICTRLSVRASVDAVMRWALKSPGNSV